MYSSDADVGSSHYRHPQVMAYHWMQWKSGIRHLATGSLVCQLTAFNSALAQQRLKLRIESMHVALFTCRPSYSVSGVTIIVAPRPGKHSLRALVHL